MGKRPGIRRALGGAALCVLTVAGGWSAPSALSAAGGPLPAVAAVALAQSNRTSAAVLSSPATHAGANEVPASAKRRLPTVPRTTSTTVMGGGNPSTWPAARAKAPSLAGAYSSNLKTTFLALTNYSDWVASHPEPKLVSEVLRSHCQHLPATGVEVMKRWYLDSGTSTQIPQRLTF